MAELDAAVADIGGYLEARQFSKIRQIFDETEPADIALMLSEFPEERLLLLFRILPKEEAAQTFVEMDSDMQATLISAFNDRELEAVIEELFVDDTVDIIEEMPANVVTRVLAHTDSKMRAVINQIMHFPKDSAGSIMTIEFVELKPEMTASDAFTRIRRTGVDKETVYTCYITDKGRHLIGVTTVKDMLFAGAEDTLGSFMNTNIISVSTLTDKEDAARLFDKYDFLALPVVDGENRLVGIITVDDAVDVIREEASEDIEIMAAIVPTDKSYMKTGVFETWRKRIPWLLLLMISATFTSSILRHFEAALAAQVALTAFIPMLMDTGGNAGGQASVTIIRGLSLGEIQLSDILRIIWKEIRVAVLCGLTLGVVNFGKLIFIDRTGILIAAVVCVTLVCAVLIAKVVGCTLPIFAKKVGFDPAVMASPFITTIVDALSLLVYFGIASALLGI